MDTNKCIVDFVGPGVIAAPIRECLEEYVYVERFKVPYNYSYIDPIKEFIMWYVLVIKKT